MLMQRIRYVDADNTFIDYRLSLLGVRVTACDCHLITRGSGRWEGVGRTWPLPVAVPNDAESLRIAADNTVLLTAWQYDFEFPGSDIRAVLSQTKDFQSALRDG
jgi:hypothetical protein